MVDLKVRKTFMRDDIVKKLYSSNIGKKCLVKTVCEILGLSYEDISFDIIHPDIGVNKNVVGSEADLVLENNEIIVNVEVNSSTSKSIQNKNNAYVCQLVLRQLKNNEYYKDKLKKVYQINLNAYDIAKDNRLIVVSRLIDIKTNKEIHPILEIVDVNLAKISQVSYNEIKKEGIEYLLYLLVCNKEDNLRILYNGDDLMEKMIDEAKTLTDNFDSLLYYDREKLKKQEAFELGQEEGIEIGFKNGILQNKKEIAINMLKNNYNIAEVIKLTGLSIDNINELKKNIRGCNEIK